MRTSNRTRIYLLDEYSSQGALASKTAPASTPVALADAANYSKAVVATGELVTLYPSNSGQGTLNGAFLDSTGRVATETGQTPVLFDDIPAPMINSTKNQAAAVVPYEVDPGTNAKSKGGCWAPPGAGGSILL